MTWSFQVSVQEKKQTSIAQKIPQIGEDSKYFLTFVEGETIRMLQIKPDSVDSPENFAVQKQSPGDVM